MLRTIPCLFLIISFTGCGGPTPVIESIAASGNTASTAPPIAFAETDWPLWRGQHQTGTLVASSSVPTTWSESTNVIWKSPVVGRGHSSPIIVGDHVIVTTADEKAQTQSVIDFNRTTGQQAWSTVINTDGLPKKHRKNSFASATAASDGHNVFAAFVNNNRLQVVALEFDGQVIWDVDAGGFKSEHGYGASPTLFEDFVIVCGDSRGAGFLAALDRASGEIVWRVNREPSRGHGSYSSPVVATLAGKPQLILSGYNKTISYDPATGEEIWRVDGPATVMANTVAFSDPYVVVTGGYPEKSTMCIKADGSGDVSDSHIAWSTSRNSAYVPSPIIDGENVLVLTGDGILVSYELKSGKRNWQERIGGNFSASPIKVGGNFFVPNENGEMITFQADSMFESIARNKLSSPGGMSSPAASDNQLFVRTSGHLYCIGDIQKEVAGKLDQ